MKYKYYEQVDFNKLKSMENILKRNLESKKDPNNYNYDLFSTIRDSVAGMMSEVGLDKAEKLDAIKASTLSQYYNYDSKYIFDLNQSLNSGDYRMYPFNITVEDELRLNFLLQTEASDDLKEISEEVFELMSNFLQENDLEKIKNAFVKSKERIYKQKIKFLAPFKGLEEGDYRKLTQEELDDNQIKSSSDVYVDERRENHDLLSLKELLLILKGKEVEKYSIALGFFNKFIPELKEEGIDAVVFSVKDKKVSGIKIISFEEDESLYYSPLKASLAVSTSFLFNNENDEEEWEKNPNEDDFFLVSVDGCVANQENIYNTGYSENVNNNSTEKAAETFLVDKDQLVRLYFTPYSYDNFPLAHNHGSVIFGSSDQTYHSVSERPSEEISKSMFWKLQDLWNEVNSETGLPEAYSSGVVSLMFNNKNDNVLDFFQEEDNLEKVVTSLSGEMMITKYIESDEFFGLNDYYNYYELQEYVFSLIEKCHPLSKMFNLNNYQEDEIEFLLQDTWLIDFAKKLYKKEEEETFKKSN